jgi:multidrug resistance efflux pump
MGSNQDEGLTASGAVEVVQVTVAPEVGGRVVEVYVGEGDTVQEGDLLFRIDDELLQSTRKQAVTTLEAAQATLESTQAGIEMADATLVTAEANVETVVANADVELLAAQKALDDLYKAHDVALSEASRNVAAANRALREAQYRLDNFTVPTKQRDMTAMEAVEVMRERLDEAREAFEPYKYMSSSNSTREDLKDDLDEAQSDYDAAIRRLEYETDLEGTKANLDKALQDLETLQDGPDPNDIAVLEAQIEAAKIAPKVAEATVEEARVGRDQAQAQSDQAEKAIAQAQASLDLIDTQMNKLNVIAAVSGVIMVRNVQPGEVLQPGASAMTIGVLDELKVTVYIPEDRYGVINIGDHASVTANSFPGESFDGVVTRIADEAEYTPRNVQTQEERSTTVYAVVLEVNDPQGKLKPGIPVDVVFSK